MDELDCASSKGYPSCYGVGLRSYNTARHIYNGISRQGSPLLSYAASNCSFPRTRNMPYKHASHPPHKLVFPDAVSEWSPCCRPPMVQYDKQCVHFTCGLAIFWRARMSNFNKVTTTAAQRHPSGPKNRGNRVWRWDDAGGNNGVAQA